jgi:hypothetical protein
MCPAISLRTLAIAAMALSSLWALWHLIRRGVDPTDLIVGDDGKASWSKIAAIGAWLVISWVVVVMAVAGKLSDAVLLGYAAIYSGTPIAFQIVNAMAKR